MDAKLRWEVQLEGIRTHLLYDGVRTIPNGLELVMLLIFEAIAYPNATKLGHQPKNVEQLDVDHEVPYTWPVFEGCHEPCCGSWPSFAQKKKLCLAPSAGGMWMELGEKLESHKEQEAESQNMTSKVECLVET
jgi:hypothetical protein